MKKSGYLSFMLLLAVTFSSCSVKRLLNNPKTRKSVYHEIITNNTLHKELMTEMMANKDAMNMMHGDTTIMHSMMDHCMMACKTDTNMMKTMNKKMMDNPEMKMKMENMKNDKMGIMKMKNESHEGLYACPMHAEVQGKYNGKCPKCGMALTEPVKAK